MTVGSIVCVWRGCSGWATITERFIQNSPTGPAEHVKAQCLAEPAHRYWGPLDQLVKAGGNNPADPYRRGYNDGLAGLAYQGLAGQPAYDEGYADGFTHRALQRYQANGRLPLREIWYSAHTQVAQYITRARQWAGMHN
jgi:hypothetical protein